MHDAPPGDKPSLKKWLIRKRNKRDLLIQQQLQQLVRERERQEHLAEQVAPPKQDAPAEASVWSAKNQEVRNRLTGRKREAQERWNRFAGTEDAGARGR